ncbi:MAG: DUF2807 domain-containing protein [Demequinaceae bacterium]|nr:DUF2807 domain-containing protein [Demequinaceae bacterium]
MKTRTLLPATAVTLFVLGGCSVFSQGPSGETVTEFHTLTAFSEVDLLGIGDVTVVPGDDYSVTVTTDATFIDGVQVEVRDGELILNEDYDFSTRDLHVSFLVTTSSLESVTLTGAGNLTVSGVNTKAFGITLAGAGNVTVSGRASTLNVLLAGAGSINTTGLEAGVADVRLVGAGDIDVSASDSLTVSLSGVGDVTYVGNPDVDSTVRGVGTIGPR